MSQNKNIPSYDEIFSSITIKEGDKARTVLSPAAYFVDLMLLKENEVNVNYVESIDNRRPDLSAIPLDYENTFDETPYLDIVNEVMASRIKKKPGSMPVNC